MSDPPAEAIEAAAEALRGCVWFLDELPIAIAERVLVAALPYIHAQLADAYVAEYRRRETPKDYSNLSYQEGYLDALDYAERVARGEGK
jgi:hypothetical protein